ncbi:unnamed protein product [Sphenostylis stenocarpa]|uniref:Uncharacterized protein n=1 Tax=Sphenostylis stenocarpa TaxID=92480 RepID=A0AA86T0I6_9FABA|nr:unnamed protein product [Sphenostylis stenocarpa]
MERLSGKRNRCLCSKGDNYDLELEQMRMKGVGHWDLREEDKVVVMVTREPVRKVRCGSPVNMR